MRSALISVARLALLIALPLGAYGQDSAATITTETPDFLTIGFPVDKEIEIDLVATSRLPDAGGKAEVKNEKGMTRIEVELDDLKPAVLFGGDFNTYVLWLVTPEGRVQNLGEFILDGEEAELEASTPLSNFGIFVTAEPHLLVDFPSRMLVLQMEKPDDDDLRDFRTAQLRYEGAKGMYDFTRETLAGAPDIERDDLAFDVAQARTAVRLAERAGAAQFATVELQAARQALQRAEEAVATETDDDKRIGLSREAVRLAVTAHTVARERLFLAQLEEERERNEREAERLRAAIAAAQSEAERARLEAEQQRLQARIEQQARERAEERMNVLRTETARAQERARSAEDQAERIRQMTEQQDQINQAEERGRQQGFNEARQAFEEAQESARAADRRYQEFSLEQQRLEQRVLEAERTLRQAEQAQQNLQNQPPGAEPQGGDTISAQQEVERARAELERARQEADQARQRAQQAEEEAEHARQLAEHRQQELETERQARQQTEQQLDQLQEEQTRTRQQLREALNQIAETRETVEGLVVNIPDILFQFDSASLRPQARGILEKVAQTLDDAGKYRLTIEGHTDSVGRPEYNRELSQARAQAVRDFLVQSGVDASLVVEVRGVGEAEPRASNDSAEGRQENRRVEILVQEPTAPARAE